MRPLVILLVPGNPGDRHYYSGFVDLMQARGHELVVFDHDRLTETPRDMLPYAEHQARELVRYLDATGRGLADIELLVIGHSVGAYIAYLIEVHRLLATSGTLLLFPFVARPSHRAFLALLGWRLLGRAVVTACRALPRSLLRWLFAHGGLAEHASYLVSRLTSEDAYAYPVMGKIEFREIASRKDASYLLKAFRSVRCAIIEGDRWSPRRLESLETLEPIRLPKEVSHAFVLKPSDWPTIAEVIEDFIASSTRRQTRRRPLSLRRHERSFPSATDSHSTELPTRFVRSLS